MELSEFVALERGPTLNLIHWLQNRSLLANPLRCAQCNLTMDLKERNDNHVDGFHWRCSGCRKRRSLRSNSFFEEFPKVALGKLLLTIYFFTADDSQRRIARHLALTPGLVSRICRRLQDVCSMDLQDRPILPFGGLGSLQKYRSPDKQRWRTPSCGASSQFRGPKDWSSHTGNRVLLEQSEIGSKNAKRDKERGHAVLSRRKDVATVERGASPTYRAKLFGNISSTLCGY